MKRISIRAGNEEIATRREESDERSRDRFAILDVFQQVGTEDGPVAATSQHLDRARVPQVGDDVDPRRRLCIEV